MNQAPPIIPTAAVTEEELRAFIGPNAAYYLGKWGSAESSGRTGFNWAAFFFGGLWLSYRRLYLAAGVLYGLQSLLVVFDMSQQQAGRPSGLAGLGLIASIFCGLFANTWYRTRAQQVIYQRRGQGQDQESHLASIARKGGTSLPTVLGFLVAGTAGTFLLAFALNLLLLTSSSGTRLTFNAGEVYYRPRAAEQQAHKLGEYLVETRFFDGRRKTVQLERIGTTLAVRLVTKPGVEQDPQKIEAFRRWRAELSRKVFDGEPIELFLCDDRFNTVAKVRD